MNLQGSQRGGAKSLALHLLKEENDHVEVHEIRGFVSNNLVSALNEAHAVSRGTKARQFLFSLSLNPPPKENVSTKVFEAAIDRVEGRLGLAGQPRAIVFHEKQGRRHCHAVWSRINAAEMKAIPLPYTRYRLKDISRELYLEHGWKMPPGYLNSKERDPKNFSLSEWQQAKRQGKDPREIKTAIQDSWAISGTQTTFQTALKNRGFLLARGDRRGFVALDHLCEVYAIPKSLGIKAKDVRARLSDPSTLPSVDGARAQIARDMAIRLTDLQMKQAAVIEARLAEISQKQLDMKKGHTVERHKLEEDQKARWEREVRERQARYNRGLRGLVDRFTGQHRKVREQNEEETNLAYTRDRLEKDRLIFAQLEQSRALQDRIERLKTFDENRQQVLSSDVGQYKEVQQGKRETVDFKEQMKNRTRSRGYERER
jgi:hypothetical protein